MIHHYFFSFHFRVCCAYFLTASAYFFFFAWCLVLAFPCQIDRMSFECSHVDLSFSASSPSTLPSLPFLLPAAIVRRLNCSLFFYLCCSYSCCFCSPCIGFHAHYASHLTYHMPHVESPLFFVVLVCLASHATFCICSEAPSFSFPTPTSPTLPS